MSTENKNDEYYLYKAKKYHYKIQKKLLNMKQENKTIPVEYEQYLQDFNMVGGNNEPNLSEVFEQNINDLRTATNKDLLFLAKKLQQLKDSFELFKTEHNLSKNKIIDTITKTFQELLEQLKKGDGELISEISTLIENNRNNKETHINKFLELLKTTNNEFNNKLSGKMDDYISKILAMNKMILPPKNIPPSSTSN